MQFTKKHDIFADRYKNLVREIAMSFV